MEILYRSELSGVSWEKISELIEAVGWSQRPPEDLRQAFEKSTFLSIAYHRDNIVLIVPKALFGNALFIETPVSAIQYKTEVLGIPCSQSGDWEQCGESRMLCYQSGDWKQFIKIQVGQPQKHYSIHINFLHSNITNPVLLLLILALRDSDGYNQLSDSAFSNLKSFQDEFIPARIDM